MVPEDKFLTTKSTKSTKARKLGGLGDLHGALARGRVALILYRADDLKTERFL